MRIKPQKPHGNAPYQASAVSFDGATSLRMPTNLNATNSPKGLFSVWFANAFYGSNFNNLSFCSSSEQNYNFNPIIQQGQNRFELILKGSGNTLIYDNTLPVFEIPTWQHIITSYDLTNADPNKVIQLYVNRVSDLSYTPGVKPGFSVDFAFDPADHFWVGGDGTVDFEEWMCADVADMAFWPGIAPDLSQASNLNKFITVAGKPVNPSVAVAAFGQPALLCSGNATGFAVNQGYGGTLSTFEGALTNAPTSPSD